MPVGHEQNKQGLWHRQTRYFLWGWCSEVVHSRMLLFVSVINIYAFMNPFLPPSTPFSSYPFRGHLMNYCEVYIRAMMAQMKEECLFKVYWDLKFLVFKIFISSKVKKTFEPNFFRQSYSLLNSLPFLRKMLFVYLW